MERQMRINEDVLRYLTVRVETHEEGPSAMMRKSDRDERRGDRFGGDRFRDERPRDRDRGERRPREDSDESSSSSASGSEE
jgi:small subunit ribosomal protein S6